VQRRGLAQSHRRLRDLHEQRAHSSIPGFRDVAFLLFLSRALFRRHQSEIGWI
jgi:hypothetical protein